MLEKAYKYILTILLLLSPIFTYRPFSIYADYYNTAPFVGINYYVEDYDNENRVTLNSGNTTLSLSGSQSNTLLVQRTSNGVSYVTSTYSQGGVSGNGGNISLSGTLNLNSTITNTQIVYRVIHFTIVLDNNYIGYVRPKVTVPGNNTNLFQQDLSVNGNSVEFSIVDNNVSTSASYIVTWSDFSLILNNSGERWTFPIDSFNVCKYGLDKLTLRSITKTNYYMYPIFEVPTNTIIYSDYTINAPQKYVFYVNKNIYSLATFNNYFACDKGSFANFTYISRFNSSNEGIFYLVSVEWINDGSSGVVNFSYKGSGNIFYMPIYYGNANNDHVSTDFALQFGLTNELLDNLNIIANGTSNSNTSSDNLDNSNSQVSDVVNQYDNLESNFNDSMNSALNDIDTSLTPSSMGSKFQTSAIWVRTQFNRMTNNTPFGSIMGFSLLLGLSLLIIGKINR